MRVLGPSSGRCSLQTLPWLSLVPAECRAEATADALTAEYCPHEQMGLVRLQPWRQSPNMNLSGSSCDGTVGAGGGSGGVLMVAAQTAAMEEAV
eukprot:7386732-Prymnesium_polylepis.1